MAVCSKCGQEKPEDRFRMCPSCRKKNSAALRKYRRTHADQMRAYTKAYCASHRELYRASAKKYALANPELVRVRKRKWQQRNQAKLTERSKERAYGMLPGDYERLLRAQNSICAICGEPHRPDDAPHGVLHVDHDHSTGRVRGLLCSRCNRGLGAFHDDPKMLIKAIHYLQESSCQRW